MSDLRTRSANPQVKPESQGCLEMRRARSALFVRLRALEGGFPSEAEYARSMDPRGTHAIGQSRAFKLLCGVRSVQRDAYWENAKGPDPLGAMHLSRLCTSSRTAFSPIFFRDCDLMPPQAFGELARLNQQLKLSPPSTYEDARSIISACPLRHEPIARALVSSGLSGVGAAIHYASKVHSSLTFGFPKQWNSARRSTGREEAERIFVAASTARWNARLTVACALRIWEALDQLHSEVLFPLVWAEFRLVHFAHWSLAAPTSLGSHYSSEAILEAGSFVVESMIHGFRSGRVQSLPAEETFELGRESRKSRRMSRDLRDLSRFLRSLLPARFSDLSPPERRLVSSHWTRSIAPSRSVVDSIDSAYFASRKAKGVNDSCVGAPKGRPEIESRFRDAIQSLLRPSTVRH